MDNPSAEHTVLARYDSDALLAAVRELPARQRQVLVLRYWLDLPLAEIADAVGLHVGSVKSSISRATATLRHRLEDHR